MYVYVLYKAMHIYFYIVVLGFLLLLFCWFMDFFGSVIQNGIKNKDQKINEKNC